MHGSNTRIPNDTDGVHDPAQAWNALTVGAFTELVQIAEPDAGDYVPIAPRGGLSPFSTTSLIWEKYWPLKPTWCSKAAMQQRICCRR